MAADWAQGCVFKHGQPNRDLTTAPYNPVGQNLYAISGADLNVTRAVVEWYNEKEDFNYDTLACTDGKMCGHYTQVGYIGHYRRILKSSHHELQKIIILIQIKRIQDEYF